MGGLGYQPVNFQATQGSTTFKNKRTTEKVFFTHKVVSENMHSGRSRWPASDLEIYARTATRASPWRDLGRIKLRQKRQGFWGPVL